MTSKPPRGTDPPPTPTPITPITKRSTGSFAVAEQNAFWCRSIAIVARSKVRDLASIVDRDGLAERVELLTLARRADELAALFERWWSPSVVDGASLPIRRGDDVRMADLQAYAVLVADAARIGVKPF